MQCNIALVGCGAIAKEFYLPALAKHRLKFSKVWLVDPNESALTAASIVLPGEMVREISEITCEVQFIIIAAPNALHFSLAQEALERGAHVLLEKPYVIWPSEGHKLLQLSAERHRLIAVNQTRRFFPHARELRRRILANEFGALKSIVHIEGEKLAWPFESGAGFLKGSLRTGVIMDLGVHVLDFYHYLLQPSWTLVSAIHDGFNGPEGLAEIHLEANRAPVKIRLSRYQKQKNVGELEFERATVRINIYDLNGYSVAKSQEVVERVRVQPPVTSYSALAELLLFNFRAAGKGEEKPNCDAASSMPIIELLDQIYRLADRYPNKIGTV